MKRSTIMPSVCAFAAALLGGGALQAQSESPNWTAAGADTDFFTVENWSTGHVPIEGANVTITTGTADLSSGDTANFNSIRTEQGVLNISGGTLTANAHSAWDSVIGQGAGNTGSVNQSGGVANINYLDLSFGADSTGTWNLSGGELNLVGTSKLTSVFIGRNHRGAANVCGLGTLEISGGSFDSVCGVILGADTGSGIFSVVGSGATAINVGSEAFNTYSWEQVGPTDSTTGLGTLKVAVDGGGLTKIFLDDDDNSGGHAYFAAGSILDVGFADGVDAVDGTWVVMEIEGGFTDEGLALPQEDIDAGWSFAFSDVGVNGTAQGEGNDTLSVTYTAPVAGIPDYDYLVEAEAWSAQSGVKTEATGDELGGELNVGWTDDGDWIEYVVNFAEDGVYEFEYRVAGDGAGGAAQMLLGDVVVDSLSFAGTGGWQTYDYFSSGTTGGITAGEQTLRFNIVTGGFNINWIGINRVGDLVDSDNDGIPDDSDAFPNDPNETLDTDGDGTGNNADTDDDGDGVLDVDDAAPLDPTESRDWDGDGIADNADAVQEFTDGGTYEFSEGHDEPAWQALRINNATLNISGGVLEAQIASAPWDTWVGGRTAGNVGVVNQTGGDATLNFIEMAASTGTQATYILSGGTLTMPSDSRGGDKTLFLGGHDGDGGTTGGDALFEVSGGSLATAGGVRLNFGDSVFSVVGSASTINLGTVDVDGSFNGTWWQNAGTTLKVAIDDGGLSPIVLDASNETDGVVDGTVEFVAGAVLRPSFADGVDPVGGTWTVMEFQGTLVDGGLVLADDVSEFWSFAFDESASPKTLSVTYSVDTDGDGTPDETDTDDDNDGVLDVDDAFPLDATESADTDSDGVGDNADAFPEDGAEWADLDGDGVGNNADIGADAIMITDGGIYEFASGTSPVDADGNPGWWNMRLLNGTLNISGGEFVVVKADAPWDTWIGQGSGGVGVVNQTGGDATINFIEIARDTGSTGEYNLSGGSLTLPSDSRGGDKTLFLGGHDGDGGTAGGDALFEISGGSLATAGGVRLNFGDSVFSVVGSSSTISLGSVDVDGKFDGAWWQNTGTTLKLTIDDGGLSPIVLEGDASKAEFVAGSILDVNFAGDPVAGEWVAMTWNGEVVDGGLELSQASYDAGIRFTIADGALTIKFDGQVDSDNDGVLDVEDVFPNDPNESADFDEDGTGDNADTDDDNDGVLDDDDDFPFNAAESVDTDGDGIGDNEDADDDGDGVFDVDEIAPEFVNISTRAYVLDGDKVMIAGFVIEGTDAVSVLIQGVGSELDDDPFFVEGNMLDTVIGLYDVDGALITENDDWDADSAEATTNADANDAAGAFPLTVGSHSSAIYTTLDPGAYTVILSGKDNAGGVALIEVYNVPSEN